MVTVLEIRGRRATITEIADRCHASGVQFQYHVVGKKGTTAFGYRRSHADALKVATDVMKRGNR